MNFRYTVRFVIVAQVSDLSSRRVNRGLIFIVVFFVVVIERDFTQGRHGVIKKRLFILVDAGSDVIQGGREKQVDFPASEIETVGRMTRITGG